jgi:hypothetical protein
MPPPAGGAAFFAQPLIATNKTQQLNPTMDFNGIILTYCFLDGMLVPNFRFAPGSPNYRIAKLILQCSHVLWL